METRRFLFLFSLPVSCIRRSAYLAQSNSTHCRPKPSPFDASYCAYRGGSGEERIVKVQSQPPRADRRIVARASMHLHGNLQTHPSLPSITFRALWRFLVHLVTSLKNLWNFVLSFRGTPVSRFNLWFCETRGVDLSKLGSEASFEFQFYYR